MATRYRVLGFMFVLMTITYMDRVCFGTTAGAMSDELGLTNEQLGRAGSFFVLGYVLFEIPGGFLADRFGARALLTRIVLWWSAFTALTGAAWNLTSLIAIRFLFGCGEAGAFPGCASAVSHWFPARERARAQAVIMFGSRIGFAATSWLAIALMTRWGWRSVYWIFAVMGIVWAAAWRSWFRNDPAEHPGVGTAELAAIRGGRAAAPRRHSTPWAALLAERNVWALSAMYSGYTWGLYFYIQWLPTYLQNERGVELGGVGPVSAAVLLCGAAANLAGGWLSDRLAARVRLRAARRLPAMAGLLGAAAFLAPAALLENNAAALVCLAMSFGAAESILAVTWAACLDIGGSHAGVVSGAMNSFGQIGGALAPWLIGLMVDRSGSWQLPLLLSAAYYALSAGLWLFIDPERPLRAPRQWLGGTARLQ